jgi:uncharacterized protein
VICLRSRNSLSGTLSSRGKFMGDSGLPQAITRRYARSCAGSRRLRASEDRESLARYLHRALEESDRALLLPRDSVWYSANSRNRMLESRTENPMQLPKYALDILVCPVCKTRVELLSDGSGLKCGSCRRVYAVRDEIPVMMPEEAKIAEE